MLTGMASLAVSAVVKRPATEDILLPRKRFKATELPINQNQRASVDSLLHTFKKKGEFDALRKKLYSQFENSDAKTTLTTSLTQLAETELERNPALLSKDRRQAAPLIEGAVERSEIYRVAEADIDHFIDEWIQQAEVKLRDIRRKEVGVEAAEEERHRGDKTDGDYAKEAEVRRQARARAREKELEAQREREREERRKRLEEERKKKEAEEALEKERQAKKEEEERQRLEWEKELEERRERKKRQDAQWERERQEREEKERKKREQEREKDIEAAALEELLREGKQAAARADAKKGISRARSPVAKESALAAIMRTEKQRESESRAPKSRASPARSVSSGQDDRRVVDSSQRSTTRPSAVRGAGERPPTSSHGESHQESRHDRDRERDRYRHRDRDHDYDQDIRYRRDYDKIHSHHVEDRQTSSSRYHEGSSSKHGSSNYPAPDRDRDTRYSHRSASHNFHEHADERTHDYHREREKDYGRDRHREKEGHNYNRSTNDRPRSRSPTYSTRDAQPSSRSEYYERSRHTEREWDRDRKYDRHRDREHSRSRTPGPRRPRSTSPPDIDRYVPGTSSRAKVTHDRHAVKDREKERYVSASERSSRDK